MKSKIAATHLIFSCLTVSAATACVTVNVNFPESAVQKATDDYVKDLYRAKERGRAVPPAETAKPPQASVPPVVFKYLSEAFLPEAFAAESGFVFKVDSPASLKIRDRLAARLDEVIGEKKAGVLGESSDGWLVLKSPEKLKPLLLKKIDKLVSDDNADRKELYGDVLKFNKVPSNRLIDIQKSFARSFQAESPSGTWIQDETGIWTQKL